MALRIQLYKEVGAATTLDKRSTQRLRVTATAVTNGADPNLFLYLRGVPDPSTGDTADSFQAVASPVDMSAYPIGTPDSTTEFPFYRTNVIELDFRSRPNTAAPDDFVRPTLEQTWLQIQAEVTDLLTALDNLSHLSATQTITLGPT